MKTKKEVVRKSEFDKIFKLSETTKEIRIGFADSVIQKIQEGEVNPLDIHLQVKTMEDVVKLINNDPEYKRLLLEEIEKVGEKYSYHNAVFSTTETGVKYDYTVCKDPEWDNLNKDFLILKEKLKEREEFLKNIPIKGLELVTDEGEVVTLLPPLKTSNTTVAVKLK